MQLYKNLGRDSGVYGYELGDGFIRVQFLDGAIYLYTHSSAGEQNINEMHRLAECGQGLNSYIGRVVRKRYERKER